MAVGRIIGSMRAQSIASTRGDIPNVVVKNVAGTAAQSLTANLAVALKQAEFYRAGIGGEDRDIDPVATRGHAEGFRFAV